MFGGRVDASRMEASAVSEKQTHMETAVGTFLNWLTAACTALVLSAGLLVLGCPRTDRDQTVAPRALHSTEFPGLPPVLESQFPDLPRPEPPDDYAALVGVSEGDAQINACSDGLVISIQNVVTALGGALMRQRSANWRVERKYLTVRLRH